MALVAMSAMPAKAVAVIKPLAISAR